jgi:hypothetical protein
VIEKLFKNVFWVLTHFVDSNNINKDLFVKYALDYTFPELGYKKGYGELQFLATLFNTDGKWEIY